MTRSPRRPALVRKPILGFGPVGWCLLVVAVALLIVLLTGYDLRYQLLRGLNAALGPAAVSWTLNHLLTFHWLELAVSPWPPYPAFGIVPMCVLLIALHIHPRRRGPASDITVALWGFFSPCLVSFLVPWLRTHGFPSPAVLGADDAILISESIRAAITVGLIAAVTRSGRLAALTAFTGAAAIVMNHELAAAVFTAPRWLPWLDAGLLGMVVPWAWHVLLYGGLLWWAIRARLVLFRPGHCSRCGYNLAGAPSPRCPECGHSAAEGTAAPIVSNDPPSTPVNSPA